MKEAAAIINNFSQQEINNLEQTGSVEVELKSGKFNISVSEVEIIAEDIPGWSVASKGNITVALDIILSDELKMEGDAREFIKCIQSIRKDKGLDLTDRIFVGSQVDNTALKPSINTFKNYICAEILADNLNWVPEIKDGIEIEVNGNLLKVSVNKKG